VAEHAKLKSLMARRRWRWPFDSWRSAPDGPPQSNTVTSWRPDDAGVGCCANQTCETASPAEFNRI